MGEATKIEWVRNSDGSPGYTFNPWIGCTKVSPACDNCYAEGMAQRWGWGKWGKGEPRKLTTPAYWRRPLKWNDNAEASGTRRRVFCASLADVFDSEVPDEWRDQLFTLIGQTPNLDWLLLTKRPKLAPNNLLPNVWLGVTAENQAMADLRIPQLLAIDAAVHFVSIEPMLGAIDLNVSWQWLTPGEGYNGLRWIICGGESGPGARPMALEWARDCRDQCQAAGVSFFFKQWGGRKGTPPLLDGRTWDEIPKGQADG